MTTDKASQAWLTGAVFSGHYEIGSLIARGGMAEVYHGVDLWSNNPVAVKVLLPQYAQDASVQQKFFREERSLRQVRHESVVSVIDSGTEVYAGASLMFLVLEYVHGCTLHQLLKVRPALSVAETLEIMLPIVEGLSEVHTLSLIHRDIKPGNVLISIEEHRVKMADFGLTRRTDQSWTGSLMGTPPYVAPEIVSSAGEVGAHSDIFALGIMMYRMLSGRLPFGGMDDQQVLYHNVNTELPDITRYAPGLTRDLVGVIKWCTRKAPAARPENATELFSVLTDIQESLKPAEAAYCADSNPDLLPLWEAVAHIAELSGANEVAARRPITAFSPADDLMEETEGSPVDLKPVPENAQVAEADETLYWTPGEETATFTTGRQEPISVQASRHDSYRVASPEHLSQSPSKNRVLPLADPRRPAEPYMPPLTGTQLAITATTLIFAIFCASFLGWLLATELLGSQWWQSTF